MDKNKKKLSSRKINNDYSTMDISRSPIILKMTTVTTNAHTPSQNVSFFPSQLTYTFLITISDTHFNLFSNSQNFQTFQKKKVF